MVFFKDCVFFLLSRDKNETKEYFSSMYSKEDKDLHL